MQQKQISTKKKVIYILRPLMITAASSSFIFLLMFVIQAKECKNSPDPGECGMVLITFPYIILVLLGWILNIVFIVQFFIALARLIALKRRKY